MRVPSSEPGRLSSLSYWRLVPVLFISCCRLTARLTPPPRPAAMHDSPDTVGDSVSIRRGRRDDAAPLARFAARIFHESFAADNDPADMMAYMAIAFSPEQQ